MFAGNLDASKGDVFDVVPMTGFCSTAAFVGETFLKNHQLAGSRRRPFTKILQQETRNEGQQQNRNSKKDRWAKDGAGSQRVKYCEHAQHNEA